MKNEKNCMGLNYLNIVIESNQRLYKFIYIPPLLPAVRCVDNGKLCLLPIGHQLVVLVVPLHVHI